MESELGEVREIKMGTFIRAAFCNISELIRPVVIRILVSGEIPLIKNNPEI